jgi:hypothetical protein
MTDTDREIADVIQNYDPEQPQARFAAYGATEMAALELSDRLPSAVPWPTGKEPQPVPVHPAPSEDAPLTGIAGWDHVDAFVVTWTAAEAAAMAALLTPGYALSQWYEYKRNVEHYIPLVTSDDAPFNDRSADMARYYHSLGLYFPCRIAGKNVLLFKSGLHLDYDGPAIPVREFMTELAATLQPKVFITTGTGGGINANLDGCASVTQLGDVIVGRQTVFDCQTQFKDAAWRNIATTTSTITEAAKALMTPDLLRVNAGKVKGGRETPVIWDDANIVTTDFFGFADTKNTYGLDGKGRACDMGDAMVGLSISDARHERSSARDLAFYAIRNASDPEIDDTHLSLDAAKKQAADIYVQYGAYTTAASVIASWAVLAAS